MPTSPDASTPPAMQMSKWGGRAASIYLVACAGALVAMLVETVAGHPGIGSMFAAFLAVPWSMLMAAFAPPLPRDWPLAAGLAVRMIPLALFMLLNSVIVRGIATRSQRDLSRSTTTVGLLCVACGLLGSGCAIESRQVVLQVAPASQFFFFNGGREEVYMTFDLTADPTWREHHAHLARVTDLSIVGDFINATGGPDAATQPLDVTMFVASDPLPSPGPQTSCWGPLHLGAGANHRVGWDEGVRKFTAGVSALQGEVAGDGQFTLYTVTTTPLPSIGGVSLENMHLLAVLQVK